MKKFLVFCLALFVFCSLHASVAGEDRDLADMTPAYEENYGTSYANNSSSSSGYGNNSSSNSAYGGSSGSGYGGSSSSGYGNNSSSSSGYNNNSSSSSGYGGSSGSSSGYSSNSSSSSSYSSGYGVTPSYEEDYGSSSSYYGGYGSTPSNEEEYESGQTYYEYEENMEEYESSYSYGGNPSYNNTSNETYTENYEQAYTGGENGESSIPFVPTSLLTGFVVDIHFLAGDPRFQYIAYHYCSDLYPGYTQCDIYNGTAANSKLVAVEVIVTAEIFAQLPIEERKLWHSHAFAVKSGILVSPNTPPDQELAVMASVMNSYGKVTDFFHSYQSFPYGGAKLAYGLAAANQIIPELANQLDQSLGLSTTWQQRAVQRQNLNPTIIEGADDYLTSGQFPQYVTQWFPVASETGESSVVSEVGETGEFSG